MPLSKNYELGTLANTLDIDQSTGNITSISIDTDAVSEGSTNLYYTDERVDDRVAALVQAGSNVTVTYDDVAGTLTISSQDTEDNLSNNTTDDLAEGSTNLYYTDARADARIALQTGAGLDLSSKTTTDLAEGTNLYYTDARVQSYLNGNVNGSIIPDTNSDGTTGYDLGSASFRWRDLFLSGTTIDLGGVSISSSTVDNSITVNQVNSTNIKIGSNLIEQDGSGNIVLPRGATKIGTTSDASDLPEVDLNIAPEVLEIQIDAPGAGQNPPWLWTWEQSTLPYARRQITNSPEISVPLYLQGTYTVNNFAKAIHGSMTQTHTLYFKWIDGAGTDNLISWVTDQGTVTDSHPDINGGNSQTVQRLSISVPSSITLPTLTAPTTVEYDVSNNGAGAYSFAGDADGDNPNIGPLYRGGTYTFNITATGHPFYLTTDNGTNYSAGTYFGEYTSGVTGSRTDNGTVTFVVPANAPDTLYYQCGNHAAMRGAITIRDLAVETNVNGNYVVYAQHDQEGHKTPIEIRPIPSLVNQMCLVYDASVNKFVPQDLATYVENTPSFENKIREVAGTAELVVEDGSAVVAKVNVYDDSTYLPLTGNNAGDQAFATDNDILYIWDGSAWQQAGVANTDQLTEGTTNLYYTDARVAGYLTANDFDTATNIVASITDSAPATLDTLNELAAALGDDPNFATTVTNSIATKLATADFTTTLNTNSIGELSDVDITTAAPTNGQVLAWDTVNSEFSPVTIQGYATSDFNTDFAAKSTTDLSEGTNLYYTQNRFDTAFTAKSTTDLTEGTNLYYTDARADARIAAATTDNLTEGSTNLYFTDARADARIAAATTDDLTEGSTNLYFLYDRVRATNINQGSLRGSVNDATVQYGTSYSGTPTQGSFFFDSLNQKLKVYTGSAFVDAVPSSSGGGGGSSSTDANTTFRKYTFDITSTTNAVSGKDSVVVAAGSFVVGYQYEIISVGTTDFTAIGASANTVGVTFTATDVGTGSGTAGHVLNYATSNQNVEVYRNGVKLVEGASNDYVATTGTSVTFVDNLASGDTVEIQVYELLTNSAYYLKSETYTQAEVNSQISTGLAGLVDSAPTTLDTLNELAAALGDDPNFATTVTNSIATKLPLSGGTLTGPLNIAGTSSISTEFKIGNLSWNQSNGNSGLLHQYRGSDGYSELQINNTATSGAVAFTIRNSTTNAVNLLNDGGAYFGGNVGIGTPNPARPLHVTRGDGTGTVIRVGNTGTSNATIEFSDTGTTDTISIGSVANDLFLKSDDGDIVFATTGDPGTASMTVKRGGNVGIGTTSPVTSLDVRSSINNSTDWWTNGKATIFGYNTDANGDGILKLIGATGTQRIVYGLGANADKLILSSRQAESDTTKAVVVDNNGKVGIGTVPDQYSKLDVYATTDSWTRISVRDATSAAFTGVYRQSGTVSAGVFAHNSALNAWENLWINAHNDGSGGVGGGTSKNVIIGGKVGIGTASPVQLLHVASGAETSPARVTTTGTDSTIGYSNNVTPTTYNVRAGMSDNDDFSVWTSDTKRFTVKNSGAVGIGTTSPTARLDVYETTRTESNINVNGKSYAERFGAVNYFRNGDFKGPFVYPRDDGNTFVSIDTSEQRISGYNSLKFDCTSAPAQYHDILNFGQDFALRDNNHIYSMVYWAKNTTGGNIQVGTPGGGGEMLQTIPGDNTWRRYVVTTIGGRSTGTLLENRTNMSGYTGALYFSEFMIFNGDAESVTDNYIPSIYDVAPGLDNGRDGLTPETAAYSGKDLINNGQTTSGDYWIKPKGYIGSAIQCYVDMTTDGGGWVLCGVFYDEVGFSMSGNTGGKDETNVKNYPTSFPPNSKILNRDFVNKLMYQNGDGAVTDYSYLSLCGRASGGYILANIQIKSANRTSSFDYFKAVYQTQDLNGNADIKYYSVSSPNSATDYVGKQITSSYATYNDGRTNWASGGYHYIPDDVSGGGEWLFRENYHDIPGTAYGGSSNVPSLYFVR